MHVSIRSLFTALCLLAIAMPLSAQDDAKSKDEVSPTGTWTWEREGQEGPVKCVLKIKEEKGKVTGTFKDDIFEADVEDGKFKDGELSVTLNLEFEGQEIKVTLTGDVSESSIEGLVQVDFGDGEQEIEWTAERMASLGDAAGKWQMRFTTPDGIEMTPEFELEEKDGKPSVSFVDDEGDMKISKVKFEDKQLDFQVDMDYDGQPIVVEYELKLDGEKLTGTLYFFFKEIDQEGELEIEGKKIK